MTDEEKIFIEEQPAEAEEQKPTAKKKKPAKQSAAKKTHVVKEGDTLRSISIMHYGTPYKIEAIKKANSLASGTLRIGRELKLP